MRLPRDDFWLGVPPTLATVLRAIGFVGLVALAVLVWSLVLGALKP